LQVVSVAGRRITVASKKALQLERYTVVPPVLHAPGGDVSAAGSAGCGVGPASVTWRLDQDEPASMAMHQRSAVLAVAGDCSSARVARLRELLIDLAPPRMLPLAAAAATGAGGAAASGGSSSQRHRRQRQRQQQRRRQGCRLVLLPGLALSAGAAYLAAHAPHLNPSQVAVLTRILAMNEYCLVLGMPGG